LDCGAGGEAPPLSLFYQAGYKTFGVDISEERIALADEFARAHDMTLNIRPGSITWLPFEDESMSFISCLIVPKIHQNPFFQF
jgi:SAM-dependent methyltransferase